MPSLLQEWARSPLTKLPLLGKKRIPPRTVEPDASNDMIRDRGSLASAVRGVENLDGVVSNVGTLASLASRIPAAPAIAGRVASGVARTAPLMAVLQGVDAARLLSPDYRSQAYDSLRNMQDSPSRLDTKAFNTSAAMQALGRAPSTLYALGGALAESLGADPPASQLAPPRDQRPLYNPRLEQQKRDIPSFDFLNLPTRLSLGAARRFFRQPSSNIR